MKSVLFSSLLIFSLFILPISVNADSNGLAGYWKFDEGSGASAYDSSGNGLAGTVSGAAWVDGISGKALNFSSVSDYFTMPANSKLTFSSGNFSVDLWFKLPQSLSSWSISKMEWLVLKNGEYGLVLDTDGKLKFYISSNSGGYMSSVKNSWNANTWYHVVGVFENGNAWKIYINGNLDNGGSATYKTDRTDCSFDVGNFLGCQTAHDNFVGAIDEVKVYSRALSASEILAEYQSFPTSSSSNSTTSTTTNTSTSSTSTSLTSLLSVSGDSSAITMASGQTFTLTLTITNNNTNAITSPYNLFLPAGYIATPVSGDSTSSAGKSFIIGTTTLSWNLTTGSSSGTIIFQLGNNTNAFSKIVTISSGSIFSNGSVSSVSFSWCTFWVNAGCGLSPCSSNQMKQTQECGNSTSGDSSVWENSQCLVANETCSKKIAVSSAICTNAGNGDKISFTVQNVGTKDGTKDILAGELNVFVDNSSVFFFDELPVIYQTGLPAGAQKQFSLRMYNFAKTRILKVVSPSNTAQASLTCSGSSGSTSNTTIKEVDKTVLLDVLFGLEQVKIKLDGLKDSALAISEYYSGKGDSTKAGKWLEISSTFDSVINSIDGITAEIKQNKDNITTDFIQKIKGEVAGVKADISSVIDKILEVM